jgi:predicted lysophospholipase L1 biosynthesis ABC-type transport system permease subunit
MPGVFLPLSQRSVIPRALEVRTAVDPVSAMAAVRRAIASAEPGLPIESIEAVAARVRRGRSQEQLVVLLTSIFSMLATGLAGFGLFGVLSHAVARRTPELGLRMALGASRSNVLWSVVRDALWLVMCGVLLGLPLAVLGGNLVSALTFGITPYDAFSVVAGFVVLLGIGAACSLVPALRAARVDPMMALRQE